MIVRCDSLVFLYILNNFLRRTTYLIKLEKICMNTGNKNLLQMTVSTMGLILLLFVLLCLGPSGGDW